MSWLKLTVQQICLSRCLFQVTHSPRRHVWHPGFVFLTALASRSGENIETCDICQEWHSCRCYALNGLHKTTSTLARPFDARDATTQNRDLRHKTFNHEVVVNAFEIVDSVGKRYSILNAVPAWIVREFGTLGSPSSHACLRAFVHGWTRWAGCPRLVRCDPGTHNSGVFSWSLAKNGMAIRPAGWEVPEQIGRVERRGAMQDVVEGHQGHARFRQRIDGHDI